MPSGECTAVVTRLRTWPSNQMRRSMPRKRSSGRGGYASRTTVMAWASPKSPPPSTMLVRRPSIVRTSSSGFSQCTPSALCAYSSVARMEKFAGGRLPGDSPLRGSPSWSWYQHLNRPSSGSRIRVVEP